MNDVQNGEESYQERVVVVVTVRASLSGTFLQTLPDLDTPLYLPAAVHRRGQRPPKGLGTNMTAEAT